MPTISTSLPSDGDTIDAADVNTPFNDILNVVNGNLDSDNLADDAVTADKIADGAVTQDKLNAASLTGWLNLGATPNTITNNGNRSYDLVFNSNDLTDTLSEGMRLKLTRTTTAPTQSTSLNGSTQYWSKSSPAGTTFTDDFCAGAWVYLTSYANAGVISRFNSTSGWRMIILSTGQVQLQGFNAGAGNASLVVSSQSVPLNKWVHISAQLDMSAFTATTTTSYVMIDGVDVPATVSRSGTNPTALVQAGDLEVGRDGTNYFPGKIAQAWYSSAKITQANIRTFMSQGITSSDISTHSIVSAFSFDGVATDMNTTNANNLSASGSAGYTSDSPFAGGSGAYETAGTTEYAVITAKPSFSTNTTVVVETPKGYLIPTSGGVSAVAYSTQNTPYGWIEPESKAVTGNVSTAQTTTSTSYTDLSTVGPSVTVNIGSSGMALISITSRMSNNTSNAFALTSFTASGTNTIAASDLRAVIAKSSGTIDTSSSFTYVATSLTPGSTTFTLKYRVDAGTGTFTGRYISVIPL